MRKTFLFLVLSFFYFSCKEDKKTNEKLSKNEVQVVDTSISNNCPLDFEKFFDKFSRDSIYQKTRIKLPLKKISYDYDSSDEPIIEDIKNISEFKYIDFTKDISAMKKQYDKYKIEKEKTKNGLIYKRVGHDNGIYISYEFKLIDECWYLVKITDEST